MYKRQDQNIIRSDIEQKQQTLKEYESQGLITPSEEIFATRIAQEKLRRGEESLNKFAPSVYFTQKEMFGSEGADVKME